MREYCRKLDGDLFGIAERLRAIDSDYFVCYNTKMGRYEVHHAGQKGDTLAVVVPYDKLDCRAVNLVRKTRVERRDELLRELAAQKNSG